MRSDSAGIVLASTPACSAWHVHKGVALCDRPDGQFGDM